MQTGSICNIEVKSTLTIKELKTSVEKARSIENLKFIKDESIPKNLSRPFSALIALESKLTGKNYNEVERYIKTYPEAKNLPEIGLICVVGKGYWYFNGSHWISWNADKSCAEVTGFIAGVLNTASRLASYKYKIPFGYYFIEEFVNRSFVFKD